MAGLLSSLVCFSLLSSSCQLMEPAPPSHSAASAYMAATRHPGASAHSSGVRGRRWSRNSKEASGGSSGQAPRQARGSSAGGQVAAPPPLGWWRSQRSCSTAELLGCGTALLQSLGQRQKQTLSEKPKFWSGSWCNDAFCHPPLRPMALEAPTNASGTPPLLLQPWRTACAPLWLLWQDGLHAWGTPLVRRRWLSRQLQADHSQLRLCVPSLGALSRRSKWVRRQAPDPTAPGSLRKPQQEKHAQEQSVRRKQPRGEKQQQQQKSKRQRQLEKEERQQGEERKKQQHWGKESAAPSGRTTQEDEEEDEEVLHEWRRDTNRGLEEEEEEEDQEREKGSARVAGKAEQTQGRSEKKKEKRSSRASPLEAQVKLNEAVLKTRGGAYEEGLQLLNEIIEDDPSNYLAYAWRGVTRSQAGDLLGGLEDLTKADKATDGASPDILRQRGNVLAALGRHKEAIQDFTRVLQLDPTDAQARLERGAGRVNAGAYVDALEDLYKAREAMPGTPRAHLFLGLAQTASGDPFSAVHSYEKAMALDPNVREGWTNWGQTMKELADMERAEECYQRALQVDPGFLLAYKLWAKLRHGGGHHGRVVELLREGLQRFPENVELRYFEATSLHATGAFTEAISRYDHILSLNPEGGDEERLQFNAFYQREVAVYTVLRVDRPMTAFNLEDFDANFKEHWGRVQTPAALVPLKYAFQPLREALGVRPQVTLASLERDVPGYSFMKDEVLEVADRWGALIQYNCTGFMRNVRQQRMAGLAALHVMEAVRETWAAMAQGKGVASAAREGIVLITGWRSLYQVAVRWRQLVEPGDPVLWIDQLTSSAFESGFGSVTPMISGQTRNIRYSMNADRAFNILKQELVRTGMAYGDKDQEIPIPPSLVPKIKKAKDLEAVYRLIGESFFIVTPCASSTVPGKTLNGTRLVITPEDPGHQFAIRTPLTPSRWKDYDLEMSEAWQSLCRAYLDFKLKKSDPAAYRGRILDVILRMTYYWYNFMPLSRGSAMTGFVTALGLFGALGYELTANIPEGMQTDWEAILSPSKEAFISRLSPWMYPALEEAKFLHSLPDVAEVVPTIGTVFEVLSWRS